MYIYKNYIINLFCYCKYWNNNNKKPLCHNTSNAKKYNHDFHSRLKKLEGVTENSVWQVLGEKSKWHFTQKVCCMRRDGEEIKTCAVLLRNIAFGEIDDTKFGICFSFPCTHNQSVEIKYISSLSAILD